MDIVEAVSDSSIAQKFLAEQSAKIAQKVTDTTYKFFKQKGKNKLKNREVNDSLRNIINSYSSNTEYDLYTIRLIFDGNVYNIKNSYFPLSVSFTDKDGVSQKNIEPKVFAEYILSETFTPLYFLKGSAGCGKTSYLKNLYLELIDNTNERLSRNTQFKTLPLFFHLSDYNTYSENKKYIPEIKNFLFRRICSGTDIANYDMMKDAFSERLSNGDFLIILDGFDEIIDQTDVVEALKRFNFNFPKTKVILSSRDNKSLFRLDKYTIVKIDKLYISPSRKSEQDSINDDHKRSIQRFYKFYESKGMILKKNSLYKALQSISLERNGKTKSRNELYKFLKTPLMASYFYRAFEESQLDEKTMYDFISKLYRQLLEGHDQRTKYKQGVLRKKIAGLKIREYELICELVAYIMYHNDEFLISKNKFQEYIALALKHYVIDAKTDEVLQDLYETFSLVLKDKDTYSFIFPEFQVFLFTVFLDTQKDSITKYLQQVITDKEHFKSSYAISFLKQKDFDTTFELYEFYFNTVFTNMPNDLFLKFSNRDKGLGICDLKMFFVGNNSLSYYIDKRSHIKNPYVANYNHEMTSNYTLYFFDKTFYSFSYLLECIINYLIENRVIENNVNIVIDNEFEIKYSKYFSEIDLDLNNDGSNIVSISQYIEELIEEIGELIVLSKQKYRKLKKQIENSKSILLPGISI